MKQLMLVDNTKKWQNKFEYFGSAYVAKTPNSLARSCFKTQAEYDYAVKLQKQFIDMDILLWLYEPYTIILLDDKQITFTFYVIHLTRHEQFYYFVYGEKERELYKQYQKEAPRTFRPRVTVINI